MNRLVHIFHRLFDNPTQYARHLGVKIGAHSTIGQSVVWPSEAYLITIGDHVQVTNGVRFLTHGGGNVIRRNHPDFDCFGKIVIGDWAYIGAGVQILPGVTIGEGTLVGAGSVVSKSTPPNSVVAGNPARYICTVEEYVQKNLKYNVGTKGMNSKQKKAFLLGLDDEKFMKK